MLARLPMALLLISFAYYPADPDRFPEHLTILVADLNALGVVRNEDDWLKTLQAWIAIIEAETSDSEHEYVMILAFICFMPDPPNKSDVIY